MGYNFSCTSLGNIIYVSALVGLIAAVSRTSLEKCEPLIFRCFCGSNENQYTFPSVREKHILKDEAQCVQKADPSEVCKQQGCILLSEEALLSNNGGKLLNALLSQFYPLEFSLHRSDELKRMPRGLDEACRPFPLRNAEVKCWKWPNWISCDIQCAYGYGFQLEYDYVSTANVHCRFSENEWKPKKYGDCTPLYLCKVILVTAGELYCREPATHEPAYCEIACEEQGIFNATKWERYECKDNSFISSLPHCAAVEEPPVIIE